MKLEAALLTGVCALALALPAEAQLRFGFGVAVVPSEPVSSSSFSSMPFVPAPADNTLCKPAQLAQEFAQMDAVYKKLGTKPPYSQKTKTLALKACGNKSLAAYKAYTDSAQADIQAMTKIPGRFLPAHLRQKGSQHKP